MKDAGQAMIYRCFNEDKKQPIGFRKTLEFNHAGEIYFSLMNEFEKRFCEDTFPVELFFYQKGKPFYVSVKGIAQKDHHEGTTANEIDETVKVMPEQIEYGELAENNNLSTFEKFIKSITNIQAIL
jgi:hypothetical protein